MHKSFSHPADPDTYVIPLQISGNAQSLFLLGIGLDQQLPDLLQDEEYYLMWFVLSVPPPYLQKDR